MSVLHNWCKVGWITVCTAANLWCTYHTLGPTLEAYSLTGRGTRASSNSGNSRGHNKPKQKSESAKRTLLLTLITSATYSLGIVLFLVAYLLYLSYVGWTSRSGSMSTLKAFYRARNAFWLSVFIQGLAYIFLLTLSFRRLENVFCETQYKLPPRVVSAFYWVIGVFTGIFVFLLINGIMQLDTVSFQLGCMTLFLSYYSLSLWICWQFTSKIRKLTHTSASARLASNMLSVSLRISILTMCALLSTLFIALMLISLPLIHFSIGQTHFTVAWNLTGWLGVFDLLVNNFCLMCYNSESRAQYGAVFGRLHHSFMDHLEVVPGDS